MYMTDFGEPRLDNITAEILIFLKLQLLHFLEVNFLWNFYGVQATSVLGPRNNLPTMIYTQ